MNILIIGNGFDIAHGLKTSYMEFLQYCDELKKKDYNKSDFPIDIEVFLNDNIWLKYFLEIAPKMDDKTWIGFENAIGNVINILEKSKFDVDYVTYFNVSLLPEAKFSINISNRDEDHIISKFLSCICKEKTDILSLPVNNKQEFIEYLFEELRKFAQVFEHYCLNEIDARTRIPELHKILKKGLSFDAVLSFNYTHTFETLYGNKNTKYCYIHGEARKGKDHNANLILGIDDELKDDSKNTKFEFVKFKKYFQRILYKTGAEYKDWINFIKKKWNEFQHTIYIVGHSLDKTDHDVLKEFFDLTDIAKIVVCYYSEKNYIDKIQRVISIIGKDELIKQVHGADWSIKFVDQYSKDGVFVKQTS